MTDNRGLRNFRVWVQKLSFFHEILLLVAAMAMFFGLAADEFVWKLLSFSVMGLSLAYVAYRQWKGNALNIVDEDGEDQPTFSPTPGAEQEEKPMTSSTFYDATEDEGTFDDRVEDRREPVAPSPVASAPVQRSYEFKLSDFFDQEEARSDDGPKAEFRYLLRKVLTVIKDVHFAHTVALFWVNRDKQQIVVEAFVSESASFTEHKRREIGTDLVSQVGITGKPQLLTDLNALSLLEMLPYYEKGVPIKTFVGVPIFYTRGTQLPSEPVAVLTVDCMGEDAYGPETLGQLGQFTKLITALIQSYTDKYDLLLDSEVLRSISRLRDRLRLDFDIHNAVRSLVDETSRVVPWDYISAVTFDDARKAWGVHTVMNRMNDPYVPAGQEIDLQHSLCGEVIQYSVPKVVDSIRDLGLPRFYTAERCESKGSLLAIPLTSFQRCYGALIVESKDTKTFAETDSVLLQKLADTTSWAMEILGLTDVATNFVTTDELTGVSTRRHFLERVQDETQRSADFGGELSMVMLAIDSVEDLTNRYGSEALDLVLRTLGRMVRSFVRPYDVVGRFDTNRLGVLLIETSVNKASLWAEKLRKNVASHILNVDGKSFSITISVGVSGATPELTDMILLENADRVLKKAVEAGGNIVRVF